MSTNTDSDNHWRGIPLSELYGSQSPWGAPEFPLVVPSHNHAVLYHIPSSGCVPGDKPPKPQISQDKWDSDHVRMPCSLRSLYPVTDEITGDTNLKKRWAMIEYALSKPIHNSQELADAILSYNTKFKRSWRFQGLHKLFNEYLEEEESQYFFDVTLPEIVKLALALPKLVQAPIPLLVKNKNQSVSFSQQQVACLLANAFFCTFPRRNTRKATSEYSSYPHINFNTYNLYEATDSDSNMEKLKSICHYFRRVVIKVPVGTVTYTRRSVQSRSCPTWSRSQRSIASLPLHVDSHNTIEDAPGLIQVDFANKFLGGGVLGYGCVQEEIRFVICPELLLSMLFTEELGSCEALVIIGSERFSNYTGYGHSFQWAGDFVDNTPRDSSGRRRCAVLAIDAVPYGNIVREFKKECINRELNKAWIGVSFDTEPASESLRYPGVATGNWGCGAFGGTAHLKSLIQLMACAEARRPMAYYTFKDDKLRDDIIGIYNLLARYNVTVGQLYKHIINFSANRENVVKERLYAYLEQVLKGIKLPSQNTADSKMETPFAEFISATVVEIEDKNSPDLFSQDDMEQGLVDVSIQSESPDKIPNDIKTSQICDMDCSDNNGDDQTQIHQKDSNQAQVKTLNQTNVIPSNQIETGRPTTHLSLFDTMKKMDEELDASISSPMLGNQNKNVSLNDTNLSMDSDEKLEPTNEVKKKIGKKITDYFSKK